jgi:two-component system, cell cycle sensor histidine kinase and response regulator CckA
MFLSSGAQITAPQSAVGLPGNLARVLLAAACYYALARFGLTSPLMHGPISPMWPPAGVAVALAWWLGPWVLPGVFIGAWAANTENSAGPLFSLGIALAATLGAGLAGCFLRRSTRGVALLESLPGLVRLVVVAALGAPLLSATIGVFSMMQAGIVVPERAVAGWFTWWLGDAMGVIVITPALIVWRLPVHWVWTRARVLELLALLGGLFLVSTQVFLWGVPQLAQDAPLAFAVYPFLIWAGLRFGTHGAAAATFLLVTVAFLGTAQGLGPFGRFGPPESFWLMQVYILCLASTAHVLGSLAAQRRVAERQLREQAMLLDRATDAIIVRDPEDKVAYWNKSAERLYGYRADEMIGRDATPLLYTDSGPFQEAKAAVTREGEWVGELRMRTKSGGERVVLSRCTRLPGPMGAVCSVLAINTDITERKRLEAHLLRSQRMESIGTMAGGIAHDLNNVLAPIFMGLPIVRESVTDPDALETLRAMEMSAGRGAAVIKQVLLFARGVDVDRVPLEAARLLRDVESMIRETFPRSIRIERAWSADLWMVVGDATQLHQVLLNLCVNARDAMPAGGELKLQATNVTLDANYVALNPEAGPGPYVRIDVVDTGMGIPSDRLERIFEPFFTTKEVGRGTGLGLATSQAIVRSHGGFIHVYSEPGKGSTFRVHLPARPEAVLDSEATQTPLPRGRGELLLIVDDEESIRATLSRTLERYGYRVLLAQDGAEAVGLYAERKADIAAVLTDMMMPVMDGPATIVALQRMNPAVRIIGASGHDANGKVAKAAGAGVKHFLPKPYTAEVLLRTLRVVLDEV